MDIPEFPVHYYRQIFAKIGEHGKSHSFCPFKGGGGQNRDCPYQIGTIGRYVILLELNKLLLDSFEVKKAG